MSKLDEAIRQVQENYPEYVLMGVTLDGLPIFAKTGSGIFVIHESTVAKVDLL